MLKQKKEAYGLGRLRLKTEELSKLNDFVSKRCVLGAVENTPKLRGKSLQPSWQIENPVGKSLEIYESDEECKFLGITEPEFVKYLRTRQMQKWNDWKRQVLINNLPQSVLRAYNIREK